MKKDGKQRLFEVMGRLDKTFKTILNENSNEISSNNTFKKPEQENNNDFVEITTPINGEDDKLFVGIVNQGIDSSLEGFSKSKFTVRKGSLGDKRVFEFHKSEIPILLRRLENIGSEEALQWKDDIENYDTNLNELDEMGRVLNTANDLE